MSKRLPNPALHLVDVEAELLTTNKAPAIENPETEVWLGEMRLIERRRLNAAERKALVKDQRQVRIVLLLATNVLAAITWSLWRSDSDLFLLLAVITALALVATAWLNTLLWRSVQGNVLEFGRPDIPGSTNKKLLTEIGFYTLHQQRDGSYDARRAERKPRVLAKRGPKSDVLSLAEIEELLSCKQSSHVVTIGVIVGGLGMFALLLVLSTISPKLSPVVATLLLGSIVVLILYLLARYNRSVDMVVQSGRLVDSGPGRLLLSDGTPWIEEGIPAEWRRLGADKPEPSFEDREIAQEAMRSE